MKTIHWIIKIIKKHVKIKETPETETLPWSIPRATKAPIKIDTIVEGIVIFGDIVCLKYILI